MNSCRDQRQRFAEALRADHAPLDDVKRESLLRTMSADLDRIADANRARSAPLAERRSRAVFAGVGLAAAAVAAVVVLGVGRNSAQRSEAHVARFEQRVMSPFIVEGAMARESAASSLLGASLSHLTIRDTSRVGAYLPYGSVLLDGPAELAVLGHDAAGLALRLRHGTLAAEIRPSADRPPIAIHIGDGDAIVRVTGTIFLIQAGDTELRVAVTRGEVMVEHGGAQHRVGAGHAWSSLAGMGPITSQEQERLRPMADARARPVDTQLVNFGQARPGLRVATSARALGTTPLVALVASNEIVNVVDTRDVSNARPPGAAATKPAARAPRLTAQRTVAEPREQPADPAPDTREPAPTEPAPQTRGPEPAVLLYREAENALRAHDEARAEATWRELIRTYARHRLVAPARYDLARLAKKQGRLKVALRYLDSLLGHRSDRALRESAAWLRCGIIGERRPAGHRACLEAYRSSFPRSVHRNELDSFLDGKNSP